MLLRSTGLRRIFTAEANLVGWWPLAGNLADYSGHPYLNGAPNGAIGWGAFSVGTPRLSFKLNGSTTYSDVGSDSNVNKYGSISLFAWVNMAAFPTVGNAYATVFSSVTNNSDGVVAPERPDMVTSFRELR